MAVHRKPRSLGKLLLAVGLVVLGALAALACGGDEPGQGGAATPAPVTSTSGAQVTPPASASGTQVTPPELGLQIGDLYERALSDLTEQLRGRPDGAAVTASVRDLKASYVRQFVELGRARETLGEQDRSAVDAAIRAKLAAAANEPWYATYSDITQHYAGRDAEFHELLVSFNIITQYANFDLLKSQAPDEAKRLGIE